MKNKVYLKRAILNKKNIPIFKKAIVAIFVFYSAILLNYIIKTISTSNHEAQLSVLVICIGINYIFSVYKINSILFNREILQNILYLPIESNTIFLIGIKEILNKEVLIICALFIGLFVIIFNSITMMIHLIIICTFLSFLALALIFIIELLTLKYFKAYSFIRLSIQFISFSIGITFIIFGLNNLKLFSFILYKTTFIPILIINIILIFLICKLTKMYREVINNIILRNDSIRIFGSTNKVLNSYDYFSYSLLNLIRKRQLMSMGMVRLISYVLITYKISAKLELNIVELEFNNIIIYFLSFIAVMNPYSVISYTYDSNIKYYNYLPIKLEKMMMSKVYASFLINLIVALIFLIIIYFRYKISLAQVFLFLCYGLVINYLATLVGVFLDSQFYTESENERILLHGNISKLILVILIGTLVFIEVKFIDNRKLIFLTIIIQGSLSLLLSIILKNIVRKL